MAVTLPPELQAALDQETRHPVVTATSDTADSAIPFVGQTLHTTSDSERYPSAILHSSGRYVAVFCRTSASRTDLFMEVSDAQRVSWSGAIQITTANAAEQYIFPSIVELGNTAKDIGVVCTYVSPTGAQQLKYLVRAVADGSEVKVPTTIDATAGTLWYESSVTRWADDNTYTLVCAKYASSTWSVERFTHAATAGAAVWTTWTDAGAMTFSGGDAVPNEKRRPFIKEVTTSAGTKHWITFDHADATSGGLARRNCYFAFNAAKLAGTLATTRYTTSTVNYNTSYRDPSIAQPSAYAADSMAVAYTRSDTSVKLNTASTPALETNSARFIHYDPSLDYIIIADRGSVGSSTSATGVTVLQASDLTVVRHYYRTSQTVGSSPPLGNSAAFVAFYYSYPKVVVAWNFDLVNPASRIDVIDIQSNVVTSIYDADVDESAVPSGCFRSSLSIGSIQSIAIAGTVLYWVDQYSTVGGQGIGQIWQFDYGTADVRTVEPKYIGYAFPIPSIDLYNRWASGPSQYCAHWDLNNRVAYFALYMDHPDTPTTEVEEGMITKISLQDGSMIDKWNRTNTTDFPRAGAVSLCVAGQRIYFAAKVNTMTAGDLTGLCWVPETDATHGAPTATSAYPFNNAETDDIYELNFVRPMGDGRVLCGTRNHGLGIWDGATAPIAYDNANVPGMPTIIGHPVSLRDAAYDETRRRLYLAFWGWDVVTDQAGVLIFDLDGDLLQPYYRIFTALNGTPATGTQNLLVATNEDDQVVILANGTGQSLAAFWARRVGVPASTTLWPSEQGNLLCEYDLMFDDDTGSFDLTPYLTGEVHVMQNIEHQPNRIEFSVARGDLFDPNNARSLTRAVLDQGRKVVFQKGEVCSDGVTRKVDLFTGFVESGGMTYGREQHPVRSVVAYDVTKPAFDFEVRVSPAYGHGYTGDPPGLPDGDGPVGGGAGIISDMAQRLAGLLESEVSIGTFDNSVAIQLQLVNMSPADMMEVAANRFKRVIYVNNSGVLVAKEIAPEPGVPAALDQITSTNTLVTMNPNESEGETTNRVTVRGVTDDVLNVTFASEYMTTADGSFHFTILPPDWPFTPFDQYIWVPYSQDYSVTAINPTTDGSASIVMGESVNPFGVTWNFTPLTAELVVTLGLQSNPVAQEAGYVDPAQIATYLNVRGTVLHFHLTTIIPPQVATITYIIPIYAQRTGTIRAEIQASADDFLAQRRIRGLVVEKVVDFPAADTASICQDMADWFLFRVKLHRYPIAAIMLGHLRQEPGDVIQLKHPSSEEMMTCLITQIDRIFSFGGTDRQTLTLGRYP